MTKHIVSIEDSGRLRHYPLSTIHYQLHRGISLMEVLASTFVIGVGLLGVLAVIPFGAFQVSKANNADHSANVLRAAVNEVLVRGMAKPLSWNGGAVSSNGGSTVLDASHQLNVSRLIMVDPFDTGNADLSDSNNTVIIYKIGNAIPQQNRTAWQEAMRGQDDLQYTIPKDQRTVLMTAESTPHYMSSGKYTWFFTFRPKETTAVALNNAAPVSVDVLACFNRTPGDAEKERTVGIASWTRHLSGAELRLKASSASALALENTKWILVMWTENSVMVGSWCKIVSRGQTEVNGSDHERTVTVVGDLPSTQPAGALIIDGVLDHARIDNVPLY